MDDKQDFISALTEQMRTFIAQRQWAEYHTPKNLAMALAGEAGELVAEFQWMTPQEATRSKMSPKQLAAIEAEMADVLIYLVVLADQLGTSLPQAVEEKMSKNAIRFPPVEPEDQ